MKRYLNNAKGITLVELLAVIVILGIVMAIAIPAAGGIISNSKKRATIANAQAMIQAAELWAIANDSETGGGYDFSDANNDGKVTVETLMSTGDLEKDFLSTDPYKVGYDDTRSFVIIVRVGDGSYTYTVTLDDADATENIINGVTPENLNTDVVNVPN